MLIHLTGVNAYTQIFLHYFNVIAYRIELVHHLNSSF